jgi:Tol biopolymer transport system component
MGAIALHSNDNPTAGRRYHVASIVMRGVTVLRSLMFILLLATASSALVAQSAQELFQQGLVAERGTGKLTDAIALFQRVVREAGTDRALAARALVRLGAAYETLGRSEARAAYDRVVRDFRDQTAMVAQARARLTALERAATPSGATGRVSVAREVWADANANSLSVPSPDGRFLVLTDWTTGDLAVRDLQRGETRRLTNKGPWDKSAEFAEQFAFSVDGKRIAYSWFTDRGVYELRTIDAHGGPATTIPLPSVAYVQPWAWTPAGDGILAAVQYREGAAALVIVKLGGQVVRLAPLSWNWTTAASISPDGRWVLFDQADGESLQRDVWIIGSDGTHPDVLVRHAANDWHPMWTPDGTGVVFLSDRTGTEVAWIVGVLNGAAQGPPRVLKGDMGQSYPIGFTQDGTLFYSPSVATSDIVVADIAIDSLRVVKQPEPVTKSFVGRNQMPDWSPDGKSLVFVSLRGSGIGLPGERVLVTLDLETSQQRDLTVPLGAFFSPRWSGDGRHIMMAGLERGAPGPNGHYAFDITTGTVEPLTPDQKHSGTGTAAWSADGRSILYVRNDSGSRASLHRYTMVSGVDETLYAASGSGHIGMVAASPDNRWIAIATREDMGTPQGREATKLLAREDGHVIRDLPSTRSRLYWGLNWAPDSRYLIGVAPAPSGQEIWRLPVDGSPPSKFPFEAMAYVNQLRLSPDGRRIVFVAGDPSGSQTASVWAIEHLVAPAIATEVRPR